MALGFQAQPNKAGEKGAQPVEGQGQAASITEPLGRGYQGLSMTKREGGKVISERGLDTEIHFRIAEAALH